MLRSENGIRVFVAIAGVIGLVIGALALFAPVLFFSGSGTVLGDSASLLSEVRAPGALLLALSAYLIWSVVVGQSMQLALGITAVTYSSYGLARIYSWFVDGTPHNSLVIALVIELIIGGVAMFLWLKTKQNQGNYA